MRARMDARTRTLDRTDMQTSHALAAMHVLARHARHVCCQTAAVFCCSAALLRSSALCFGVSLLPVLCMPCCVAAYHAALQQARDRLTQSLAEKVAAVPVGTAALLPVSVAAEQSEAA